MQDNSPDLLKKMDRRWKAVPCMTVWGGLRWRVVRAILSHQHIEALHYAVWVSCRDLSKSPHAELYSLLSWMLRTKPKPQPKQEKPRGPSAQEKARQRQAERVHLLLAPDPEDARGDGEGSRPRELRLKGIFGRLAKEPRP